jgi:hypothetical protein
MPACIMYVDYLGACLAPLQFLQAALQGPLVHIPGTYVFQNFKSLDIAAKYIYVACQYGYEYNVRVSLVRSPW